MAQKTVQALIEMCTGNYNNQEIAYKGQIIVSINVILKMLPSNDDNEVRTQNLYLIFCVTGKENIEVFMS